MAPAAGDEAGVTVDGNHPVTVGTPAAARDRFGWATREFTIRCHSGRVIEGRWSGVPLAALVDAAAPSADTTHVVVTARDGYRAAVGVAATRQGLLGLVRETVTVTGGSGEVYADGTPRFLGPGLDSTEAVREVARIEPVRVPPGVDPLEVAAEG